MSQWFQINYKDSCIMFSKGYLCVQYKITTIQTKESGSENTFYIDVFKSRLFSFNWAYTLARKIRKTFSFLS